MNIDNINRLIDHLNKVPDQAFNLLFWLRRTVRRDDPSLSEDDMLFLPDDEDSMVLRRAHPAWAADVIAMQESGGPYECNTVACIAGHASLLGTAESGERPTEHTSVIAQKWLGLDDMQAEGLFLPFLPENKGWSEVTPKIAARACETLRDTGENDWWAAFGLEKPVEEEDDADDDLLFVIGESR